MSKGFASVSTTTQPPTRPTAPAVEAQEIQSKWLSYFEDLDDPRGAFMSASSLLECGHDCHISHYWRGERMGGY